MYNKKLEFKEMVSQLPGLSYRARRILTKEIKAQTISELAELYPSELLEIEGMGKRTFKEIEECLHKHHGIRFKRLSIAAFQKAKLFKSCNLQ
jgi:ERCC4-type nuclease